MLPNSTTPYTVYQFLDATGTLLYVGVTAQWSQRATAHRKRSHWYGEVAETRTSAYATANEAATEELRLIAEGKPRYNRDRRRNGNRGWHLTVGRRHKWYTEGGAEVAAVEEQSATGLTTREAAQRAEVSERSIRTWIKNGDVTHFYDPQGVRRIPVASLDKHLQRRGAAPVDVAPPASVPGLSELAATLEAQRKELRDLRWQNGYLTAQLETTKQENARLIEEKEQQKLLTAGAEVEPEAEAEPEANDVPTGFWARVRAFLAGEEVGR